MAIVKKKIENTNNVRYVKFSEHKAGDLLVLGHLVESKLVEDPFKPGQQTIKHEFATDEGTVVLNSSTELNRLLEHVPNGTLLEVVFAGKESVKTKDGKYVNINKFEVSELVEDGLEF